MVLSQYFAWRNRGKPQENEDSVQTETVTGTTGLQVRDVTVRAS